jgi:hypothetical protein
MPFQTSPMFVGKSGAYPSGAHLRLLALPINIRLCWKGLVYNEHEYIRDEKSFITLDSGLMLLNISSNKLECLYIYIETFSIVYCIRIIRSYQSEAPYGASLHLLCLD